jgi:hypothetical protein
VHPPPYDYGQGYGYAYPGYDPDRFKADKRLKTLGGVQLAFAALGLLGLFNAVIQRSDKNPLTRRMMEELWSGDLGTWMTVSLVMGAALSLLLAAAGFSMLKRRQLARTLTLAHGAAAIATNLVSLYFTFALLMPRLESMAEGFGPGAEIFKTTMSIALGFGAVVGLVFPIVELVMVTRPLAKDVLASFGAPGAPPG